MKTINTNWKYLKYLFLLGPVLSIMGISAELVSGIWGPVPLALLISGIVIIGLWLLFTSSVKGFWSRRSTEAGTNALLATMAMLVILALINFLGVRYSTRLDLTEDHLFTIAPESQQVVRSLKQPVKAWVFVRDPNPVNRELLENYRRYGSQFSFEFVDPVLKPGLAEKFNVQQTKNMELYLESGAQRQLVENLGEGERISETKLTNSIIKITSDRLDKVYFLQGHGEHSLEEVQEGISQALRALQQKNYVTEPLNLAKNSEIPKDATVIVIDGPKKALLEGEVKALKNYLTSGGSLLVMADPNTNPGLDSLLQEWGVKLDNLLAIDASGKGQLAELGPATPLVTRYGDHPITKNFGNGISFYPLARPIETTPVVGVEQTPLLITEDQSWGASNIERQPLEFNPQTDRRGPLKLGVALSRVYPKPSPSILSAPSASPTASATPTSSKSPTTAASASPTASATPTPTSSKSPTTTPSASPTASATPTSSKSPTTTPSASPTASATPTPTSSKSPTTTPSASPTASATPTSSKSPTTAASASPTASATPTPTSSKSPTTTPSASPTASATPTSSKSPTTTASSSPTGSATPTPTSSPAKPDNAENKPVQSRLVVLGNSEFATDDLFRQELNGDVLLNSISWLSKRDDQTLSIRPKEMKNRRINMTPQQAIGVTWMALVIMPLIGFITAGLIWWRRR